MTYAIRNTRSPAAPYPRCRPNRKHGHPLKHSANPSRLSCQTSKVTAPPARQWTPAKRQPGTVSLSISKWSWAAETNQRPPPSSSQSRAGWPRRAPRTIGISCATSSGGTGCRNATGTTYVSMSAMSGASMRTRAAGTVKFPAPVSKTERTIACRSCPFRAIRKRRRASQCVRRRVGREATLLTCRLRSLGRYRQQVC